MIRHTIAILLVAIVSGCSTARHTEPQRTATEQLLISSAADRAAEQLTINLPAGAKVYLNTQTFEAYDQRYALGAIRQRLLEIGARLVDDRRDADVIVDARAGALSLDKDDTLVGIPEMNIPVPLAGPLKFPEIALFKRELERGIAKLAIVAYGQRDGELIGSSGPVYGFSHRQKWVVLLLISWTTNDILPRGVDEGDILDIEYPF